MAIDPLFPSISNPEYFYWIFKFFGAHALTFFKYEFYIAIFGLISTIFHIIVLTRQRVLVTSVISIMIGIAICDFISMTVVVGVQHIILIFFFRDECTPPPTYTSLRTMFILLAFRDSVIRCSTWLSVLLAMVRLLTLKFKSKPSVKFGFYSGIINYFISSIMSFFHSKRTETVETGPWTPGERCETKIPGNWMLYEQQPSVFFNDCFRRIFSFLNGFLTRIFPCVIIPILTILLVLEIRKTRKVGNNISKLVRKRRERTTFLVIMMAITFFVANLPSGIFTFFQVVFSDIGFLRLSAFVDRLCNGILTINSIFHCFICFLMSTDYRKTVIKFLKCRSKNTAAVNSIF